VIHSSRDLFFTPPQLVEFSRFYAAEVAGGKYPYVDFDPDERWHQRIYRDRRIDIWLISWLPSQGTQLHDHGGSSGAFTVLSGTLTETVVTGARTLHDNERDTGSAVGFGPHYVHDVRNTSDSPAVSVHAYSAPLTTMNYYDLSDGELVRLATLATDDPEAELDPALVDVMAARRAS
jgi:quercetin dioxygenase-like cupin family protein